MPNSLRADRIGVPSRSSASGRVSCEFSDPPATENRRGEPTTAARRCRPVLKIQSDAGFAPFRWEKTSPAPFSKRSLEPASGYRNRTSGALTNVGSNGYSWSSSPTQSSTNAGNLNFNATNVNPQNNNSRAYGFPVRCVRGFAVSA